MSVERTREQEFLAFCRTRSAVLFRVAYAITADQHLAEDLLQIALERVARAWSRVDDPEAYVRRTMYHESISWWRRCGRRETPIADPPDRPSPQDQTQVADLRSALRAALLRLGPRQRAVLVLRYLEDRTERDVAQILGCSPATVSSQAHRALARLRVLCPELADLDDQPIREDGHDRSY